MSRITGNEHAILPEPVSNKPTAVPILFGDDVVVELGADAVQRAHWAISILKRWLFGTHGSAVSTKYLQAYLDQYVFRYNRRGTKGVGRIAARTIAQLVAHTPLTMRQIVKETVPYRMFPDKAPELTA